MRSKRRLNPAQQQQQQQTQHQERPQERLQEQHQERPQPRPQPREQPPPDNDNNGRGNGRVGLNPIDVSLLNTRLMTRLVRTNIANLMDEGINNMNSNFNIKFIEAQMIRIISPQGDSRASVYNRLRNCGTTTN